MTDSNARTGGPGLGRIALILAAVVALVAVGFAIWNKKGGNAPPPPPAPTTIGAAPAAGDVASAIGQLEARLAKNPKDAQGWRMLGWSYYQTERFPDAVNAYRHATAIDPANAEGWSALGEAIALAGKGDMPADATAAFRKALAIDPKDARARYFTAVGKDLAGDHKGAVDDWIALLKDSPPGAPWEQNVRQTIAQVAAKNKIDLAGRVPPPSPAALAAAAPAGGGGCDRRHSRADAPAARRRILASAWSAGGDGARDGRQPCRQAEGRPEERRRLDPPDPRADGAGPEERGRAGGDRRHRRVRRRQGPAGPHRRRGQDAGRARQLILSE